MVVGFIVRVVTLSTFAEVVNRRQLAQVTQLAKCVVHRRARNIGHNRQDALVQLLCGGMTVVVYEQFQDHPPLWCDFESVLPELG